MSYPILHKAEVCTSVEQVRGDRVLEGVEMPLALRDVGALAVVLHQFIQSAAADGRRVAGQEQRGDIAGALFQIGFQGFHFVGLQGVQAGEGIFEPVNSEPVLLHVEISSGQHPNFRGAEAVAIGEQKDSIVALGVYSIEQATHFILREEIDGGRCPARACCV